jgi:hypothetical protein
MDKALCVLAAITVATDKRGVLDIDSVQTWTALSYPGKNKTPGQDDSQSQLEEGKEDGH